MKDVFQKYMSQYQATEEMMTVQENSFKVVDARQEIDQLRKDI